jgi:hypothetical protein
VCAFTAPHTSHLTPHTSHLTPHTSHLSSYSFRSRATARLQAPIELSTPETKYDSKKPTRGRVSLGYNNLAAEGDSTPGSDMGRSNASKVDVLLGQSVAMKWREFLVNDTGLSLELSDSVAEVSVAEAAAPNVIVKVDSRHRRGEEQHCCCSITVCDAGQMIGALYGEVLNQEQVCQRIVNKTLKDSGLVADSENADVVFGNVVDASDCNRDACMLNFVNDLYLDIGEGVGGGGGRNDGAVSKFRFLKHSQVPNCQLQLRVTADDAPPFAVICLVALRRIAVGTPFTVDFSQR